MENVQVNIRDVVQSQILNHLRAHPDTMNYGIELFYGAFSAELFAEFIHSKLQAGKPMVFARCGSHNSRQQLDTMGTVHNTDLEVEVVVASNIVRDKEFGSFSRFTDKMLRDVKTVCSEENFAVEIPDTGNFNLVWRSDESLFRVPALSMDAQRVNYQLQGLVYQL